jgi:hypothetical protein
MVMLAAWTGTTEAAPNARSAAKMAVLMGGSFPIPSLDQRPNGAQVPSSAGHGSRHFHAAT